MPQHFVNILSTIPTKPHGPVLSSFTTLLPAASPPIISQPTNVSCCNACPATLSSHNAAMSPLNISIQNLLPKMLPKCSMISPAATLPLQHCYLEMLQHLSPCNFCLQHLPLQYCSPTATQCLLLQCIPLQYYCLAAMSPPQCYHLTAAQYFLLQHPPPCPSHLSPV